MSMKDEQVTVQKKFGTLAQHQSKNASTQSFIEMITRSILHGYFNPLIFWYLRLAMINGEPIAFSEAFFGSLARGPGIALMSQIIGPQPQAVAGAKGRVLGWVVMVVPPVMFVGL